MWASFMNQFFHITHAYLKISLLSDSLEKGTLTRKLALALPANCRF